MDALRRAGIFLAAFSLAAPCHAGMKTDLANCTGGLGGKGAKACTRILKSGRLPKKQLYIAYYNRGWAYRNAGDYKRALRDFNRVLELNRRFADGHYSRAVVHQDLGQRNETIKDLDRYVELKKKKWSAHYGRALMLRRLKQYDRALADLRAAEKLKPTEQKIIVMRALVLSDQGDHAAATSTIAPVIVAKPNNADALHARAVILFRRERLDEAEADVKKALKIRKSFDAAHLLKGRILERKGKTQQAREHYERAIASSAKSVEQLYAQNTARARLKSLEERKETPVLTPGISFDCRRFIPAANMTITIDCKE